MGHCSTKLQHERLNEHNDRYFDRVYARNSIGFTDERWWKRSSAPKFRPEERRSEHEKSGSSNETPTLLLSEMSQTLLEDESLDISSFRDPASPSIYTKAPPRNPADGTSPTTSLASPKRGHKRGGNRRFQEDAVVDGWRARKKGHALQLRLAKYRFLQMATDAALRQHEQTLTNTAATIKSNEKTRDCSQASPRTERTGDVAKIRNEAKDGDPWNSDFDSNGMIWVEIERNILVTAVAMSRNTTDEVRGTLDASSTLTPFRKTEELEIPRYLRPLLMAVGDEEGNVTVTQIVDEQRSASLENVQRQEMGTLTEEPMSIRAATDLRKFGETLELAMNGRIRSIDFSPDGRYLVIGGDGCVAAIVLIVLDPQTDELQDLRILHQLDRADRIYSVRFHPRESCLAISGFDGKIAIGNLDEILSTRNGRPPLVEVSRLGLLYCMEWSPTGELFAVGGSDKQCSIYNNTGNLVHEILRMTCIQTLQWNHDGSYLAIGDREVVILDGVDFRVKCEISNIPEDISLCSTSSSKYRVTSVCWSPDGHFLAIGGSDGACLVVETKSYALVHEVRRTGAILCLAWGQRMLNGDHGRYLAISDANCSVALIKAGMESGASEVDEASSSVSSSYFGTGSDWVLREDSFRDVEEDDQTAELSQNIERQGIITAVVFSRSVRSKESAYLAYTADDCSLTIMTMQEWKAIFQMEFAKPLRSLTFSHSDNYLALGGDEGVVYVLSVQSRSIIFNTIFNASITTVAFSCQDERLAVGTTEGLLTLLCPDADWEAAGELDYSESPVLTQAWCSKTLAVAREDGSVALFDTEKAFENCFVPLAEFHHTVPVLSLAFGASGHFLAMGSKSGMLSIFNSKKGWLLYKRFKFDCSILATKWSPSGRHLAIAGTNQTCRIIDTITWLEVSEAQTATSRIFQNEKTAEIASIDWSVDGNWVALGSHGGGTHVLGTSGWQLLAPSLDHLTLSPKLY